MIIILYIMANINILFFAFSYIKMIKLNDLLFLIKYIEFILTINN